MVRVWPPVQETALLFAKLIECTPVPKFKVELAVKFNVPVDWVKPAPVPVFKVPPPSVILPAAGIVLIAPHASEPPVMVMPPEKVFAPDNKTVPPLPFVLAATVSPPLVFDIIAENV